MDTQDTTKSVAPDRSQDTCRPEDVIPKKEKIIYGAADLFGGGQAAFISVILLAFFTDIIGIDAAVAGTVIMVSKIWDAIIDPSMGIISDNTRWSKLGRRKPYMIIGGALIPFGLAFLFAPITGFGATSQSGLDGLCLHRLHFHLVAVASAVYGDEFGHLDGLQAAQQRQHLQAVL